MPVAYADEPADVDGALGIDEENVELVSGLASRGDVAVSGKHTCARYPHGSLPITDARHPGNPHGAIESPEEKVT